MITNYQRHRRTDRRTDGRHAIPRPRICTKVHCAVKTTRNSAKLTNQRVSYAFTSIARLVSMSVIFCLLPSSSIVIVVFLIFCISEQHVWELWVWIQFTGLTLPLRVTPMNNPITRIASTVAGLHFLLPLAVHAYSANFRTVFTVRRYALHGICDRNSVCLSVCLSHSWTVSTWFDLRSWFLHHMVASSF